VSRAIVATEYLEGRSRGSCLLARDGPSGMPRKANHIDNQRLFDTASSSALGVVGSIFTFTLMHQGAVYCKSWNTSIWLKALTRAVCSLVDLAGHVQRHGFDSTLHLFDLRNIGNAKWAKLCELQKTSIDLCKLTAQGRHRLLWPVLY
jgi:hypothetical protein